jgi:antitoxin component of MazEF toxin-antitoxin module
MVNTVKIRRVGNSNVVSLPRALEQHGFVAGAAVAVVPLRSGQILLVPSDQIDEYIDSVGQQILDRNREALDKLAAYDQGDATAATE